MERRRKRDQNTRQSTVPRKQSLLESEDCIICFDKVSCRGKLSVCDHWFCFRCIHEWSKNTNTCPVCKKKFRCISKTNLRHGKSPVQKFRVSDVDQRVNDDDEMSADMLNSMDNHGDISFNGERSGNDSLFVVTDDESWWTSSEDSFNFTSLSSSSESSVDNSFDKHLDNSFDKHLDNIHSSDDSSDDDTDNSQLPSATHTSTSRARFHCTSKSRQKASDRQFKKAAKRTESALLQKKKQEKAPSQATSSSTRRDTRSASTVTTSSSTWTSSQSTSIVLSSTWRSTQHASATSFSTRTSIQTASTASSTRRSGQRATSTRSFGNSGLWLNATRGRPFSSQTTKKSNKKSRTRDKKPAAEAHCSTHTHYTRRAANDLTPSPKPIQVTRKHKSRANKLFDSDSESSDDQVKAPNMRSKRIFSLFSKSPEESPDKERKKKRWVLRERQNYQFE